ncbi:MAG: Spy/CpxP family protein refolding chaperone [Thermodesulfobacteriota bacterium]
MKSRSPIEMRLWGKEARCWKSSELELTPEQQKELYLIQQSYFKEIQLLRSQLLTKRLELREMLTNPAIQGESIRPKYLELVEIQTKLEKHTIDYLIKVRNFLTPEQLPFWCPEQEFPMFLQMRERMGPRKSMAPKSFLGKD